MSVSVLLPVDGAKALVESARAAAGGSEPAVRAGAVVPVRVRVNVADAETFSARAELATEAASAPQEVSG